MGLVPESGKWFIPGEPTSDGASDGGVVDVNESDTRYGLVNIIDASGEAIEILYSSRLAADELVKPRVLCALPRKKPK